MKVCVRQVFTLITVVILTACTNSPSAVAPTVTQTLTPSSTPLPSQTPTSPPTPTATQIPPLVIEPVTVPGCNEDGTGDSQSFNELLELLLTSLQELDSFRYQTLYRYSQGNTYADEDLSVEVIGTHHNRLSAPVETSISVMEYPLASQSFERSQVVLTELQSGRRTETIITPDGFWARNSDDPGWIAFDPATPGDLFNMAEMFSPEWIVGLVVANGVAAEAPLMMQVETIAGLETVHRCWIPPSDDPDVNAWLQTGVEHGVTYLNNTQVHLWTAKDDSQLVRLIVTGDHVGEGLGHTGEHYRDYYMHEIPSDFLLLMDVTEITEVADIQPPPADQISVSFPPQSTPVEEVLTAYDELPLPSGAELVDDSGTTSHSSQIPREFWYAAGELGYQTLETYFKSGWDYEPTYQLRQYQTMMSLSETTHFYLHEMSRKSWQLKANFFQAGQPALYLFFERDDVTLPVILETGSNRGTHISAILLSTEELVEPILSGWTSYTTENSPLPFDSVTAFAFDQAGKAWIGTSRRLTSFDGESWTSYSAKDLGLAVEESDYGVNALTVDVQGRMWVGTGIGLSVFDGAVWHAYTSQNSGLPWDIILALATDKSQRLWIALGGMGGVSMFDGKTFTNYGREFIGGDNILDIALDQQDQIWVFTDHAGVYMFDGKLWKTILNNTGDYSPYGCLAIDGRGWIWNGTSNGLRFFNGLNWTTYTPVNSEIPISEIDTIVIDKLDRVWVGGWYGTVFELEPDNTWKNYTPIQDAARGFSTNAMAVDGEGRIWVGTDDGLNVFIPPEPAATAEQAGLRTPPKLSPPEPTPTPLTTAVPTPASGWTYYTERNSSLASYEVNSVVVDGQDRVWVATTKGLNSISPTGEWVTFTTANSHLINDTVNALFIDDQNRLWIGTNDGLSVIETDGDWNIFTPEHFELKANPGVEKLHVDSHGNVWMINTSQGVLNVMYIGGKRGSQVLEDADAAASSLEDLAIDPKDQVWLSYRGGVGMVDPGGRWISYTAADLGLTGEELSVYVLEVDPQGRVWLDCGGFGLVVLAPDGSRTTYKYQDTGMEDFYVTDLYFDLQGRTWVGTSSGLGLLGQDGRWEFFKPANPILTDGTIAEIAVDSQGRVWLATGYGLMVFNSNKP